MSNKRVSDNADDFAVDPDIQEIIDAVQKSIDECYAAGITGVEQIKKTIEVHSQVTRRIAERKKLLDKK